MTYKKIAQLAGVSPSTVSKVMSGSTEISQKTADRIRKLVNEYGCTSARYFRSNTNGLEKIRIAILVPEIISVFYAIWVSEIARLLDKSNIICNIYITGFDENKTLSIIQKLADEGMTDGLLVITPFAYNKSMPLPIVKFSNSDSDTVDCVDINWKQGITDALRYLQELGHENIGFIGEINTIQKQEVFYTAAEELGLHIDNSNVFLSNKRFEHIGMEAAEYFLKKGFSATAFLTAYDEVAMGAMQVFKQEGLRIPDDISIIGMNDIPFSKYTNIPLTTLQMFNEEVCHIAVKLLIDKILHPENHIIQHIKVHSQLIIRNTTGPISISSDRQKT